MDAAEYRSTLAALGITQQGAADLLGVSLRSSQGYASGAPIPGPVDRLLKLHLAHSPPPAPPPTPTDPPERLFAAHGKTQTMAAWAAELCMPRRTIESRLRYGWTVEQALTRGRAKPGPRRSDAPAMTARPAPPRQSRARYKNIAGRTYGHLTAVDYAGDKRWHCRCVCGETVTVAKTNLRAGRTTSCGCGGAGRARAP